ncbi:ABC transporter permease subunit [Paenibacillus sp. J5C_2022]|nr:ABC transporter permease subunit [Paenibacillus sp. J5C2022]
MYKKHKFLFMMLLPALVYMFIFHYMPMYGITIAFKNFNFSKGIWGSDWIGLDNFERLFGTSSSFLRVLRNTLVISGMKLVIVFSGCIVLALLINEVKAKVFKRVVQNISYLPHFISWVIIGSILVEMLSLSRGVVNQVIEMFGGTPIYFLTEKYWFLFILVSSDMWQSIGWGSIIYLAAISGVDPALYESARMDGASRIRQMISITLPCIANVVAIMFILQIGNILSAGFDQIFNLYNFRVYEVADIIDTYAYRIGLSEGDFSLSTAVSLFKNVFGLILVIITNYVAKRLGHTGLW